MVRVCGSLLFPHEVIHNIAQAFAGARFSRDNSIIDSAVEIDRPLNAIPFGFATSARGSFAGRWFGFALHVFRSEESPGFMSRPGRLWLAIGTVRTSQ